MITYFGIYLVYNLEHFGIFYSAKPGNPEIGGMSLSGWEVRGSIPGRLKSGLVPLLASVATILLCSKLCCPGAIGRRRADGSGAHRALANTTRAYASAKDVKNADKTPQSGSLTC